MIDNGLLIMIGISGGLAVGTGFVAFLTVLGIIPRLMQLTRTIKFIRHYEWCVIFGALTGTFISLRPYHVHLPFVFLILIGLFAGVFVGMLAAALTEVLNVFPILSKRLGIHESLLILLMAIVFGKVAGSLFHWTIFVK